MRCYGIIEILKIYSASAVCRLLPAIYPSHSRGDTAVHERKQSILLVLFTTDLCGLSVTLFKLEDHGSLDMPDSNPESGLGRLSSPARCSKRVKADIANTEGMVFCGGGDEELPGLAAKVSTRKGKVTGKLTRRPSAQTSSSESAASPKRPKAIKEALEKPRPAPTR